MFRPTTERINSLTIDDVNGQAVPERSTEFRLRFRFRRRMWTNGHFRCTFGFGVQLVVNSVVAESRVQSTCTVAEAENAPDAGSH